MRRFLLKIEKKLWHLLYGTDGNIVVHLAEEMGKIVEARLFSEGQVLDHIAIEPFDGGYWIDMITKEDIREELDESE